MPQKNAQILMLITHAITSKPGTSIGSRPKDQLTVSEQRKDEMRELILSEKMESHMDGKKTELILQQINSQMAAMLY